MPGDGKHMFGGSNIVKREIRVIKQKKSKRGLLMPKRKTEEPKKKPENKIVRLKVGEEWLTVDECMERGLTVKRIVNNQYVDVTTNDEVVKYLNIPSSDTNKSERRVSTNNGIKTEPTEFAKGGSIVDVINLTNKIIDENEADTRATINKREIEILLKNIQEELEVLYEDDNAYNKTVATHKEGQVYAYKLLLRRLTNK